MKSDQADKILAAEQSTMPYGKHKGQKLEDIPTWYLKWAAESWDNDRLATLCDLALQGRE